MSIDPKGTKPGLAPQAPKQKIVNLKCRNQDCASIEAIEIPVDTQGGPGVAPSRRMYQCTECHQTWGLPVGGAFMH